MEPLQSRWWLIVGRVVCTSRRQAKLLQLTDGRILQTRDSCPRGFPEDLGSAVTARGRLRPPLKQVQTFPSAVFDAMWNIKPRIWPPGVVANPRDADGHRCGLRLARR